MTNVQPGGAELDSSDEATLHNSEVTPQGPSRASSSEGIASAEPPLVTELIARKSKSKFPTMGASMKKDEHDFRTLDQGLTCSSIVRPAGALTDSIARMLKAMEGPMGPEENDNAAPTLSDSSPFGKARAELAVPLGNGASGRG